MQNLRALLHAASGVLLGPIWFAILVALWASGIGMTATLLGLAVLWFLFVVVREFAALEAGIAHSLLGADAYAPARMAGWKLTERLKSRSLWHAQLYLLMRFLPGLAIQCVLLGLVVQGAGLLAGPVWYWAPPDGIDLGIVQVDTLGEALAFMPAGVALMALGWWLAGPYGRWQKTVAERLLHGGGPDIRIRGIGPRLSRTVAVCVGLEVICVIVWAATGRTSGWPLWTALGLSVPIATQVALMARSGMRVHMLLAVETFGVVWCVWGLAGGGYLWPFWVGLGLLITLAVHALFAGGKRSVAPRVEQLTRTRAEVVGAQEDELRRIERDLHDGAQARLVSVAMSLGLAEERLDADPERARELMAEAQVEARQAIRELRDLARGIAPPVLADRGLAAAIEALAATSPMLVAITGGEGSPRPTAAIERAGYFVAAEALANAGKHASGATRIDITIERNADVLTLEIADDGRGGANPAGPGLVGLRQRVEAVDGNLTVTSPAGAGTRIRASLPCASS